MATEALKSTPLTNLDATPMVPPTTGEGGGVGVLRHTDGSVTATTGVTAGSTYQLVRVPSNAKIKHARIKLDAAVTTFTGDIGFYYSTSTKDGTSAANQGTAVNTTSGSQLFGAGVALASQVTFKDFVESITAAKLVQPLWQACGLTKDPGGFFDLVITSTATNSGAPVVYADVEFVE